MERFKKIENNRNIFQTSIEDHNEDVFYELWNEVFTFSSVLSLNKPAINVSTCQYSGRLLLQVCDLKSSKKKYDFEVFIESFHNIGNKYFDFGLEIFDKGLKRESDKILGALTLAYHKYVSDNRIGQTIDYEVWK